MTEPSGVEWDVRIVWLPRWRSLARRFDAWWEENASGGDLPIRMSDLAAEGLPAFVFGLIGAGILVALLWWIVIPLLLIILDLVVVLVLLVLAVAARVLLFRPWTVRAFADVGPSFAVEVKGWRAALRRRDEIADQLRRGERPPRQAAPGPDRLFR